MATQTAAYYREWRRKNPDKIREYNKRSKELHPGSHAAAEKRWRQNNPERVREYDRTLNQRKRDFIREVVGDACVDCAEARQEALEYHHLGDRDAPHGLIRLSWRQLKEEVMHLIALCGTCHNVRHRGSHGRSA